MVSRADYSNLSKEQLVDLLARRDSMELEREREERHRQQSLLKVVAESTPDVIFLLDRQHRLQYCNGAMLDFIGGIVGNPALKPGDLLGQTCLDIFGDVDHARRLQETDERVMSEGRETNFEDRFVRGGEELVRLTLRTPIFDENGVVTGMIGIARDVTELKKAEAERMAGILQQRSTLVRELHHRLKNHLQSVVGLMYRAMADYPEGRDVFIHTISQISTISEMYGLQSRRTDQLVLLGELLTISARQGAGGTGAMCTVHEGAERLAIPQSEAVSIALALNELIAHASGRLSGDSADRFIGLSLEDVAGQARIGIRFGPAGLPPEMDFMQRRQLDDNLDLAWLLLPRKGATLAFKQEGRDVVGELVLQPPLVCLAPSA